MQVVLKRNFNLELIQLKKKTEDRELRFTNWTENQDVLQDQC